MVSIFTDHVQLKKIHVLTGRLSAYCWWLAILMMLVHLGFCFEPWDVDASVKLPTAIVKNESVIRVLIALRWVSQAIIYFLFGKAILRQNQKQMIALSVCAIILPIIRGLILGFSWVNYLWDIVCWVIIVYWIGWAKWVQKKGFSTKHEVLMIVIGIACIFIRSYYGSAETNTFLDYLAVFSFLIQDMIRSFAMIFLGLWLLSLPKSAFTQIDNC